MKNLFFGILAVLLIAVSFSSAVDTREIEMVRAKRVLESSDLDIIDAFVQQAVQEMASTTDFSSIAAARSIIVACSKSKEGAQIQFDEQFCKSAEKYIGQALEQARQISPPQLRYRVITNLLILADGLENPRLANLALGYIDNSNEVVRYWAVHCLTNPVVVERLSSGSDEDLNMARRIADALEKIVSDSGPETLRLIAEFAAGLDISQAEDLLMAVANRRIKSYEDWTVEYELLDAMILQLLADRMATSNPAHRSAGRRFAQLYSYVFQRYIKGRDILTNLQKERLASVLVETEKSCIARIIDRPQTTITRAVEGDSTEALRAEHDRLLGSETERGQIPARIDFDYSQDGSDTRTAPRVLPDPPTE